MSELRSALRALRATPVVTVVVILSLALAIGANTAMFSLVDSLLLRTLPVERAEQLVSVEPGSPSATWSDPAWREIRRTARIAVRRRDGVPDDALQPGAARTDRLRRRADGQRPLLRPARRQADDRQDVHRRRRSRRRRQGRRRGRHRLRVLAAALQRRGRCDRAHADRRPHPLHHRRRHAAGLLGHRRRPHVRRGRDDRRRHG